MSLEAAKIEITAEQLSAISDKLVSQWIMDDMPYELKSAIGKAVAERVGASDEWDKLAEAVVSKFEARRDEIAQRIVTGMVEQLSRGIVEACRESVKALAERMSKIRMY